MRSNRKIVVLTSLVAMLTLASALLLFLAPPPLAAQGFDSLSAADHSPFLDAIFKTAVVAKPEHWKFIFIHHSATANGDTHSLALPGKGLCDHFVIGNGHGSQDGAIQMSARWNTQEAPAAPLGVDTIQPDCISICLVGDFDRSMPTPTQLRSLSELVTTLQTQFRIGADKVILLSDTTSPSGIGRYFPVTAFRDQILP
jgi:hypothetical protein